MTGLEIFFVGSLLLCNAVIAGALVFGKNGRQSSHKADEKSVVPDYADEQPEKEATPEQKSCVGASSFDIDRLETKMKQAVTETMKETFPILVKGVIGDVRLKDVEFAEDTQDKNETIVPEKSKFTPLSSDETAAAFDTDIRDFDDAGPSAPAATGASLDELENAFGTAMDKDATPEQQAEAGKCLSEIKDTQLYERLVSANDDIDRRVNLCIRMSIQAEIEAKNSIPRPPRVIRKSVSVNIPADNPDDFNPADMLP